ncbi:MAG: GIY-YIG nuclease family protein [Sphingomonadaceae bacterium]|jgi:hypothetical protein
MVSPEVIIDELNRVASELGRTPGKQAFEALTGIRESDWLGMHWARWNDVVRAAGLSENAMNGKYDEERLLQQLYEVCQNLGHFPTTPELKIYSRGRPEFASKNTFANAFGSKDQMVSRLRDWMITNRSDDPLIATLEVTKTHEQSEGERQAKNGWVYLLRSGMHYKIGRSDELERRVKQISIALPEKVEMEHAIETDDPAGIEAYWHKRFADKRMNGEWFKLDNFDVKAFKRRKFQ